MAVIPKGKIISGDQIFVCTPLTNVTDTVSLIEVGKLTGMRDLQKICTIYPFMCDDTELCCAGPGDGTIKVWDLSRVTQQNYNPVVKHNKSVNCCALMPDNSMLISVTDGGNPWFDSLRVWHSQTAECINTLKITEMSGKITSIAVSPSEDIFVVRDEDINHDHWNSKSYSEICNTVLFYSTDVLKTPSSEHGSDEISGAALQPLFTIKCTNDVFELSALQSPRVRNDVLSFSPDGKYLLSVGSIAQEIYILDIEKRASEALKVHDGLVLGGRFSSDGRHILTWSSWFVSLLRDSGTTLVECTIPQIKLFDFKTKQEIASFSATNIDQPTSVFSKDYYSFCVFHTSNSYIVACTTTGLLQIHDCNNLEKKREISAHKDKITCVRCVPGLPIVVTGSDDEWVKVWTLPDLVQMAVFNAGTPVNCVDTFENSGTLFVQCGDNKGRIIFLEIDIMKR